MDPQCGWCYGNSNNSSRLYESFQNQFDFELLVGGMWLGENAPNGGENLEQFIRSNGPRMEATTNMPLSEDFYKLCKDTTYSFSSLPGSAAIVLAKQISPSNSFAFTQAVQKAQFFYGKRLDSTETYLTILRELNIDADKFEKKWMSTENVDATSKEFYEAQKYASGFPTLLIQKNEKTQVLTSGYFNLESVENYLKDL